MKPRPSDWPKLRQEGKTWCVDAGMINGTRTRRYFKHKADATTFQKDLRDDDRRLGEMAHRLSAQQRLDATYAFETLQRVGLNVSLRDVIDEYVNVHGQPAPNVDIHTIMETYEALLYASRAANKRERTVQTIASRLRPFTDEYGPALVQSVTTVDIENWLSVKGHTNGTRRGMIASLRQLFNYAKKREWIEKNPADAIEKPLMDDKMPEFMPVEDVIRLFKGAKAYEDNDFILTLATGFFMGVRTSELKQLGWGDIGLLGIDVTIRPEIAKSRRTRVIEGSKNFGSWWEACIFPAHSPIRRVMPDNFATRRRALCKKLGVRWPANCMRHTFATMHYAAYEDAAKTAAMLGHTSTDMLFRHYRGLATKAEAIKYWEISP